MKIALIGPGSSGKSTMAASLRKKFKLCLSHVSRPPRPNEKDGVDYHFHTPDEFIKLKNEGFFCQAEIQNAEKGWWYGTAKSDLEECDIFIMTPKGFANMPQSFRDEALVIYLQPGKRELFDRLLRRKDANESANDRLTRDEGIFSEWYEWDIMMSAWKLPVGDVNYIMTKLIDLADDMTGKEESRSPNLSDNFDSLEVVEYIIEIEKGFNLVISDQDAEKFKTFRDIAEHIYRSTNL